MKQDSWARAEAYEPYVGRWSRKVAPEFIRWLGLPGGLDWLDVGCGTGALTSAILALASPRHVCAYDLSPEYVAYLREQLSDPRVELGLADATALPAPSESCDAAVSGLVLNFVREPERAVAEMRRAVLPGGTVAAYVWDYAGRMQLMRYFWEAAAELDSTASELDEGQRFELCRPEPLRKLFESAGLRDVAVHTVDVPTRFRDFDDYWQPFLGGQGPAPGYAASLPEERQAELRELLRRRLPTDPDGSIVLVARAWAIRGSA